MQKKSEDFSVQEALRLANSPAGQQLLATLQQATPEQLQKLRAQTEAGNISQMQTLLQQLGGK